MKDHCVGHTVTRRAVAWLLASVALLASNGDVRADVITFAQFTQQMVSDPGFLYANNGTNAGFNSLAGGIPILLTIADGFAPGLDRVESARLVLSSSTTAAAIPPMPPDQFTQQHFTGATNVLQILLATPVDGKTNFLTATFTDALFSGRLNSSVASLKTNAGSGSGALQMSFTSDFLAFTDATELGLSLSFSSLLSSDGSGGLQMGDNGFLKSFTASGTGTFDTLVAPIAEPPSLVLATIALLGLLRLAWKARRTAQITCRSLD
jgi:hypothetical protein